jgi:hypothetical protein
MNTFRQEREFQKLKQRVAQGLTGIAALIAQLEELDARGDLDERARAGANELKRMVKEGVEAAAAKTSRWSE